MTSELPQSKPIARRRWLRRILIGFVIFLVVCAVYVRTHPLVFNESFFNHAHCIVQSSGSLHQYTIEHTGRFPEHTNGYGDALLLLVSDDDPTLWPMLTGPGYDSDACKKWLGKGMDVPESECGRVYVQGLSNTSNPEIAILFDKLPTPGGDHCHGFKRLTAPLCREVLFIDGGHTTVRESQWLEFSRKQIELLVREGFDRTAAESLYVEKGKVR